MYISEVSDLILTVNSSKLWFDCASCAAVRAAELRSLEGWNGDLSKLLGGWTAQKLSLKAE